MATSAELALLRDMISEPDESNGWTDEKLEAMLESTLNGDGSLNLRRAAGGVWEAKAASYATLNDVTESGSSRRLSQTFDHFMKMAALYGSTAPDPVAEALASRPSSEKIVRPTRG